MIVPFANDVTACMGINNPPGIDEPGLPSFAIACGLSTMAGINYIMDFIPPTPPKVAKLKPPTIDIFIQPFLANIKLPDSYPAVSFGLFSIPGVGIDSNLSIKLGEVPPVGIKFDPSGVIKLMATCVMVIFETFTSIVTSLIKLQPQIPSVGLILNLFKEIGAKVGLAGEIIVKFAGCLAISIVNLIKSITGL